MYNLLSFVDYKMTKRFKYALHLVRIWCCLRADVSYFLFCMPKRDVCVTSSPIVFQRPAGFPRSWEHAVIGWHTVRIVWLNTDWLLSNNYYLTVQSMKNVAVLMEDSAFALIFCTHPRGFGSSWVPAPEKKNANALGLGSVGDGWCIMARQNPILC